MAPSSLQSNGRVIQSGGARILCVADVRGLFYKGSVKGIEDLN